MKNTREIAQKLKNKAYVQGLESEGINVDALKKNLNSKQNDNSQGISK